MRQEVIYSISNSSQFAAQTLSQELDHLRGSASLIVEIVRDRIAGYPQAGWDEDLFVPFQTYPSSGSSSSGGREQQYPLKSPLLPRDWNTPLNVNGSNHREHLQELFQYLQKQKEAFRASQLGGVFALEDHSGHLDHDHDEPKNRSTFLKHALPSLSTASAVYSFQGACDPSAVTEADAAYYPDCTEANNNGTTGGVVWPTSTSAGLEQRAADIGVLLKPIWESRPDLLDVSVHFVNDGAGSMVHFPSFVHHNTDKAYQSIGCDWLHENINPNTGRPFLTREQTEKCKPAGTWVSRREANPMEQDWCRDQALHPDETRFYGPQIDRFFTSGGLRMKPGREHNSHFWVVRVGRAIFDRYSGELIGCASMGVLTNRWSELIIDSLSAQDHSDAVVVRAADGVVVAGGNWSLYNLKEPVHVTESGVVPSASLYQELREALDTLMLDEASKQNKEEASGDTSIPTAVIECSTGRIVSASMIPGSGLIYIQAVGEDMFDVIDEIKRDIDDDVLQSTVLALVIGGIGICMLMAVVHFVSMALTRPLKWMQQVAWSIVNHRSAGSARQSLRVENDDKIGPCAYAYLPSKCTPATEITELVKEFMQMIHGFSGIEGASTVARPTGHEIRNTLAWHKDFQQLWGNDKQSEANNRVEQAGATTVTRGSNSESGSTSSDSSSGVTGDYEAQRTRNDVAIKDPAPIEGNTPNRTTGVSPASDCMFRSAKTGHDSPGVFASLDLLEVKATTKASTTASLSTVTTMTGASSSLYPSSKVEVNHGWRNKGRNLNNSAVQPPKHEHEIGDCVPIIKSSLFRWIVLLIVIPMVITNTVIATTVSSRFLSVLPTWLENVERASFDIQLEDMTIASKFAAVYAEALMATPVRDLFVVTRVAEWLVTDAIDRQGSAFVEMTSGSEECKVFTDASTCPYYDDKVNNAPCDCAWSIPQSRLCIAYDEGEDTRRMQKLFFAAKASDADEITGRRIRTTFPAADSTASNTSWWKNVSLVPGAQKGEEASGYETTYDRMRVVSALSTMMLPVYNMRTALVHGTDHRFFGATIGFEADGMLAGYTGCGHPTPRYPHWQSSEMNYADQIRPDLCPLGSFGYDSRCRDWYAAGKAAADEATATKTSVFVTAPYVYPRTTLVGSSVTQAIVDPKTGEHVGQALIDFLHFDMEKFGLNQSSDRFHIVITPSVDVSGGDTVVGPDLKEDALPSDYANDIVDRVFPYDGDNSTNRNAFVQAISEMKLGHTCYGGHHYVEASEDHVPSFTRTIHAVDENNLTTEHEESFRLAYDPVYIRALDSLQSDDYTRGLRVSKSLVYSIGLARTEASLEKPFKDFQRDAGQRLHTNVSIYMVLIVLVSVIATVITCRLSVVVTRPMIILLKVVQNINDGKIDDAIPPLFGGSREVNEVYTSFAKLYKVVRVSNNAFFSRNLNWACHFVRDALNLFTKIDDKKAIAIASANLGSTLLAINCGRTSEERCICLEVDGICCVREAAIHFETAVKSGTEDFGKAADMNTKVEFAEQLSDRLFNRGLYYLLCKDDPCADENFEECGMQDLTKAQALDHDVQEYWIENGVLVHKFSVLFDRLLRRLNGLCALLESGIEQDIWDIQSLAHDCHRVLSAAWEDPSTSLFEEYTEIGRLQQLEGVLIQLQLQRNEEGEAARISMRMLLEDEYIDETAFQYAAAAVLQFTKNGQSLEPLLPSATRSSSALCNPAIQKDVQRMLKSCRQRSSNQTARCMVFCLDLCEDDYSTSDSLKQQLLELYDSHCGTNDYFGLVAPTGVRLSLEPKRQKEGTQKKGIQAAIADSGFAPMSSVNSIASIIKNTNSIIKNTNKSCKTLNTALDSILASEASATYDTYLVHFTDAPKRTCGTKAIMALKTRIEAANAKRRSDIHLIVIDLEEVIVKDENQNQHTRDGIATYTKLCQASPGSCYIPASLNSLEEDMKGIQALLSPDQKFAGTVSNALMAGITMEKF